MVFWKTILRVELMPQEFVDVPIHVAKAEKAWRISVKDTSEQALVIVRIKAEHDPNPSRYHCKPISNANMQLLKRAVRLRIIVEQRYHYVTYERANRSSWKRNLSVKVFAR
jgi:hypothetical protein